MRIRRAGFKLVEVAAGIAVIGTIMTVGLPSYLKLKDRARESEIKSSLHSIQLSIERYAVDIDGDYPAYLIGGEPGRTLERTSDPLLRKGYLQAYPPNPFQREGRAVLDYQADLPDSTLYPSDPLSPGTQTAGTYGSRFGWKGTLMGSVLADPRYRTWLYVGKAAQQTEVLPTYADAEFDFWDIAPPGAQKAYLPGEFFYKCSGPIKPGGDPDEPVRPMAIDAYMLGGYGSLHNPGKDVLGDERSITYMRRTGNNDAQVTVHLEPWTRSKVANAVSVAGSPYSPCCCCDSNEQLHYGNPNGIRDSLVLVVTAGEGYVGEQ
jgi:type II secretory pathway pseudopilin PulG